MSLKNPCELEAYRKAYYEANREKCGGEGMTQEEANIKAIEGLNQDVNRLRGELEGMWEHIRQLEVEQKDLIIKMKAMKSLESTRALSKG
jgi:hypothetical protein